MNSTPYRVLARKYRPQNFDDLVGQEVLVRTLSNAFSSGRIAHAFLLTGIRGIGKTTTARIIARGLNCIGPHGNDGPTTRPCGECPNCRMILEERHVDIVEMDAASRTGVDDIREIIDTVHYAPTSARYKIYIIDEVHMLSKNAFNALLKTLEEPPAHAKFIFATTELRKLPVTIVSRCQRFDLRRLDVTMLAEHLKNICKKENVSFDEESLTVIASAAEGSVRDALSLLDQAIAMSAADAEHITLDSAGVRDMLGMADKTRLLDLLELSFSGQAAEAIAQLRNYYERGSDPLQLFYDLLSLLHYLSRTKIDAALAENVTYSDTEQARARLLTDKLSIPALSRGWQMTLKGIEEIKQAPHPLAAAEMLLIRLCYSADLPSPEKLLRRLKNETDSSTASSGATGASTVAAPASAPMMHAPRGNLALASRQAHAPELQPAVAAAPLPQPESFLEIVALFQRHREVVLYSHLVNDVRLIAFRPGHIEVLPTQHIPADFAARVSRHLSEWCGRSWRLSYGEADATSEPSLREQQQMAQQKRLDYVASHPHMQTLMQLFPGAEILEVQERSDTEN